MTKIMNKKRGLIMGVANDKSIAWGIAKAVHDQGAELAFTYQGDAMEKRVKPLAEGIGSKFLIPCDVTDSESIDDVVKQVEKEWGGLDFLVHAVAYSDKEELKGRYVDTTLKNFLNTMHVSCFSFTEICQKFSPLMKDGGSFITLSYLGANRVMPNYNVMGVAKSALESSVRYIANDLGPQNVRVNALSAGPMKTLAGSAIANARYTYRTSVQTSPLQRPMTLEDIGGTSVFLLSDLGSGVTGQTLYVDGGFEAVGMLHPERIHAEDA